MTREEYCAQVLSCLNRLTGDERQAVREELEGHMEDRICDFLDLGWDEPSAESRTLELMGDPAEVGRALNRQYPLGWKLLGRIAVLITTVLCILAVLGFGMLGFVWDSFAYRIQPPTYRAGDENEMENTEAVDIRVRIGNDVLRVYQVSVGRKDGEYVAGVTLCTYDRIPGGVVSGRIIGNITVESQRGESRGNDGRGGGSGHWLAEYGRKYAPIQPGDDHVTLRYERFGETVLIDVPLPEGGAP